MTRFIWLFVLLFLSPVHADTYSNSNVPEPLKPWVNWVLQDAPEQQCPFFYNNHQKKYCAWPSQLTLDFKKQQGHFSSTWQVYGESYISLPGNTKHWPQNVTVNGKPALVIKQNNAPAIKLNTGYYQLQGQFFWDHIPDNLSIPTHTGIMTVSVLDKPINTLTIKNNQLWLKASDIGMKKPENKIDQLNLQVFRKIYDDIPLQLITYLSLEVSGKQREIKLPHALLQNFIPIHLDSPLPARLETDGSLLIQVRPGRWNIELTARHPLQLSDLSLNIHNAEWPDSEIWSFAAQPSQRVVEIEQVSAIDPSQSNLPSQWRNLPAFLVNQGDTMHFKVIRRGDPEPEPNDLSIRRQLWLDFAGTGYSIQDKITGKITHGWRLDNSPETQLGHVTLNGQTQLITQSQNGETQGIELRKGQIQLSADSRVDSNINKLSVTGWQQKFNTVSATLHLPPGWHLLAVSGVDNDPDSWVTRWTLLDLFLVLIAALAVSRLWNYYWGLFALLTLVLTWHEADAPRLVWLNILVAISLIKVLPEGYFLSAIKSYRAACWLVLTLITLPFLVNQIRTGLYPQLEKPWQHVDKARLYQQDAVMMAEIAEEDSVSKGQRAYARQRQAPSSISRYVTPAPDFKRIDPDANLQTGPGLPQWQWTDIALSWNGSVDSQQQLHFWYLSPATSLLINILRVIVVIILSLLMLGIINKRFDFKLPVTPLSLGLVIFTLLPGLPAYADYPDPELLNELKQRLLKAPDCLPECAQISTMQLNINAKILTLELQAHAQENVAIPLPARFKQWLPQHILVDGLSAKAIIRDTQGILWVNLTRGIHQLKLTGLVPRQSSFTLPLPLKPQYITQTSQQWSVEGLKKDGTSENQLHFTRINTAPPKESELPTLSPSSLPAFIRVERTLQLGLDWHISTRVIRISKEASAVTLKIPLISGESISSADIRSETGYALVHMTANQQFVEWQSLLEKSAQITLQAPETEQWSEIWKADISPIWHIQSAGIAAIHHQDQAGNWLPEWQPWLGETITLTITRPKAVKGQTLTIDKSILQITSGKRNQETRLELDIRSSKGTQHSLSLPENARLQSVRVNGMTQPIRQDQQNVTLPIKPGKQHYDLNWHEAKAQSSILSTPALNLGIPSVNTHLKIHLGKDRWTLLTTGPQLGPAVLFWGVLIVLALLALALGKTDFTPLKHWQWFLLFIGLSQIPLIAALVVVAWLIALGLRQKQSTHNVNIFNLTQIILTALSIASLIILFIAVEQGLLGSPDMQVAGNQSTAFQLNWYQDRSASTLPTATVISIPLLSYRILMLIWSLWLAISLLNWLKWGWQCFSTDGLWKKSSPKTGAIASNNTSI